MPARCLPMAAEAVLELHPVTQLCRRKSWGFVLDTLCFTKAQCCDSWTSEPWSRLLCSLEYKGGHPGLQSPLGQEVWSQHSPCCLFQDPCVRRCRRPVALPGGFESLWAPSQHSRVAGIPTFQSTFLSAPPEKDPGTFISTTPGGVVRLGGMGSVCPIL